jgi:putative membrane protein
MRLHPDDHALVTTAVAEAEAGTSGEIVTIVAARSDDYRDVALLWAALASFLLLALVAAFPSASIDLLDRLRGGWGHPPSPRTLLTILFVLMAALFGGVRALLGWSPLLLALTPAALKSRRTRARAVDLFRVGAEKRTTARTGVLLYLSLAEHRAEIVADEAIHAAVAPESWGDAMADLIEAVRDGRPGAGMAAAVARIGGILRQHLPRSVADHNELPDRLIEL